MTILCHPWKLVCCGEKNFSFAKHEIIVEKITKCGKREKLFHKAREK